MNFSNLDYYFGQLSVCPGMIVPVDGVYYHVVESVQGNYALMKDYKLRTMALSEREFRNVYFESNKTVSDGAKIAFTTRLDARIYTLCNSKVDDTWFLLDIPNGILFRKMFKSCHDELTYDDMCEFEKLSGQTFYIVEE